MRLEFDLDVGALYIRLSDAEVARTREAGDNAAVDIDATGGVVGIEVLSTAHPWPLADILDDYAIPASEVAQITAYFGRQEMGSGRQEAPKISIESPAPRVPAAV